MRGCVHVDVWVRVCVRPEDGAFPACGCVVRCVCAWVHLCGCVCVVPEAQTWTASTRLVGSMAGGSTEHRTEVGVLL